jgi:hypothetical protein
MSNGSTLAALIDNFYENFLLRDILTKITPGLILLAGIFLPGEIPSLLTGVRIFGQTAVFAFIVCLSWILGIGIECLGRWTGFLWEYDKDGVEARDKKRLEESYWRDLKLWDLLCDKKDKNGSNNKKNKLVERTKVMMLACGNGSLSIFIVLALHLCVLFPCAICAFIPAFTLFWPAVCWQKLIVWVLFLVIAMSLMNHNIQAAKRVKLLRYMIENPKEFEEKFDKSTQQVPSKKSRS